MTALASFMRVSVAKSIMVSSSSRSGMLSESESMSRSDGILALSDDNTDSLSVAKSIMVSSSSRLGMLSEAESMSTRSDGILALPDDNTDSLSVAKSIMVTSSCVLTFSASLRVAVMS